MSYSFNNVVSNISTHSLLFYIVVLVFVLSDNTLARPG
jgi:hypothetical protein